MQEFVRRVQWCCSSIFGAVSGSCNAMEGRFFPNSPSLTTKSVDKRQKGCEDVRPNIQMKSFK